MVLIDLTGESVDRTSGFGPFDFVPSDEHCFDDMVQDDDTKHLPRVYPPGVAKLENGGVVQEGSAASGMRPITLLDLAPEDRTRIYQSLVDELRSRPEGDAMDAQLSSAVPGIRFIIADKTFDADLPGTNDPFVAVVAQPPTDRNIDHRIAPGDPPQRLDVLETFKALRSGEIDRLDPNIPPCWKTKYCGMRINEDPMDVTPDNDASSSEEEEEAELSDAHSDSSGWDSDTAEVTVNRRAQHLSGEAGWEPAALLSARLDSDTPMADSSRPPLRIMISPLAAASPSCPIHSPTTAPHRKPHLLRYCVCFTRHPSVYDDVRALAQSHPVVAAELGALLWRDAVLEVDEPAALLRFAAERPAAMDLVRGLVLTLDCAGTDMDTRTGDLQAVVEMGARFGVVVVKVHTDVTAGGDSVVWARLLEWGGLVRRLRTEGLVLGVSNLYCVKERVMKKEEEGGLVEGMRARLLREWTPVGVEGGTFELPLRTRGL